MPRNAVSLAHERDSASRAAPSCCWSILTLVWGTNWPLFAFAVREISVWTFRAVAVTLAGVALLAVARARGQSLVHSARVLADDRASPPSSTW